MKLAWQCIVPECESPRQGGMELCATHAHEQRKEHRESLKPVKKPKPLKRTPIKKVSPTNLKNTITGERLTEKEIKTRLSEAFSRKACLSDMSMVCDCCEQSTWDDHDHTISKKRCKELGKTELIYDIENIEYSCRECHMNWESYKSGEFRHHRNYEKRMEYLREHDYEGWIKRAEIIELFNRPKETI